MSARLYGDAYLKSAPGRVVAHTGNGGLVLDASLFYPNGGGQPGDCGRLDWEGGGLEVVNTLKGEGEGIVLIPADGAVLPPVGAKVMQVLNWDRRYRHMRIHTALHLLSVVIPLPVTGGQISPDKGRLDFDMPDAPADKQAIEDALNALIARDLEVSEDWITDAELAANPDLVKTMSVQPPTGAGRVRLLRIHDGAALVDLQPCGGTHVRRTAEIGAMRLGKVEKKSRLNRRVNIHFAEG
ncbi:MAG: alanyl-tRNA editing protein [Rhodobacteraceae bacterium]|nr:alanyl-tRNA editing protein [Paracoccaceae bacterium]